MHIVAAARSRTSLPTRRNAVSSRTVLRGCTASLSNAARECKPLPRCSDDRIGLADRLVSL